MANLTHLNDLGDAEMVDITSKEPTARTATAEALVDLTPKVAKAISDKTLEKVIYSLRLELPGFRQQRDVRN